MADQPKVTDFRPPEMQTAQPGLRQKQPVFIDPNLNSVQAAYAQGMAARAAARKASPPKGGMPVGGGPRPPIPPLNAPFEEGMTMGEQAARMAEQARTAAMQGAMVGQGQDPNSIVEPVAVSPTMANMGAPQPAPQPRLRPTDTLPDEAKKDPAYQTGYGADFAVNQPYLAMRYGVIRDGQRIPPQMLMQGAQGAKKGLSDETLAGLKAIEEASRQKLSIKGLPPDAEAAGDEPATSAASLSSRVGRPPEKEGKELSDKEQKEVDEAIKGLDSFDYDTLRQMMSEDVLNNPKQKEIIEGRCKELDIQELILKNRVSQDVPIVEGKFVVTYTSMTGEDDLALKRLVMEESKSVEVTERYLLDKYAFMAITCGLTAINGNPAPDFRDEHGNFEDKRFWIKFNWVMKRPLHMLAVIGVNHSWFEMRVRKLFVAENLGNG